eukprot:jgi/Botrbrau1/10487/Bobra.0133s0090.1
MFPRTCKKIVSVVRRAIYGQLNQLCSAVLTANTSVLACQGNNPSRDPEGELPLALTLPEDITQPLHARTLVERGGPSAHLPFSPLEPYGMRMSLQAKCKAVCGRAVFAVKQPNPNTVTTNSGIPVNAAC